MPNSTKNNTKEKDDSIRLVKQHVLKSSNPFYSMFSDFCMLSRNLYNQANYILRHQFLDKEKQFSYEQLDTRLKQNIEYPDYKRMPTAQSAQQTLRLLCKNWKSYWKSIKDWKQFPFKYTGRPKIPKYRKGKKGYVLTFTNQNCTYQDGIITFPEICNGFILKTNIPENTKFQQVRFIPTVHDTIIIEVVYKLLEKPKEVSNDKYLSLDIGLNNLVAVGNNFGQRPFIINGKGLKSINHRFNMQLSHFQSIIDSTNSFIEKPIKEKLEKVNNLPKNRVYRKRKLQRMKKKHIYPVKPRDILGDKLFPKKTKRIGIIYNKRAYRIKDFLHKASKILIDYAIDNNVSTIIIGRNKNWKQKKKGMKDFIKVPHYKFIQMIEYKAKLVGIKVVKVNESYTSGTSFLDNEKPTKKFYNKSRRKYRGLFISNEEKKINADVNAAMQILRKYLKNASFENLCKKYPDFKKEILSVDVKNVPYKMRITTRKKSNLCNNR